MFKSTSQFFSKVFKGKVTFTEQHNYIESITCNYDLKKLQTLSIDLTIFISDKIEDLECGLKNDQIVNEIERYKELGLKVPYKEVMNLEYFSAKIANLPLENIPEKNQAIDLMEMFYSSELFNIKHLQYKIKALYNEQLQLEKESRAVPVPKDVNGKKLTVDQLALKMVYEGNTIVTREEHGNDLYNKVMKWVKLKNRTANPDRETNLQLENKIRMFERVIDLLDDEFKQRAIDEVKMIKSHLPKN